MPAITLPLTRDSLCSHSLHLRAWLAGILGFIREPYHEVSKRAQELRRNAYLKGSLNWEQAEEEAQKKQASNKQNGSLVAPNTAKPCLEVQNMTRQCSGQKEMQLHTDQPEAWSSRVLGHGHSFDPHNSVFL